MVVLTKKLVTGLELPETRSRAPFRPTPWAYTLFRAVQFANTRAAADPVASSEPADCVVALTIIGDRTRLARTIAVAMIRLVMCIPVSSSRMTVLMLVRGVWAPRRGIDRGCLTAMVGRRRTLCVRGVATAYRAEGSRRRRGVAGHRPKVDHPSKPGPTLPPWRNGLSGTPGPRVTGSADSCSALGWLLATALPWSQPSFSP